MEGNNLDKDKIIKTRIKPSLLDEGFLLTNSNLLVFKKLLKYANNKKNILKILDLGCGYKPFKKFFPSDEYIGVDIDKASHADIILDLNTQKLPFDNDYFDIVIISETLEHLYNIKFVIDEVRRVVKKNGYIFISTPFLFPEHGHPFDFFRYTEYFYRQISEEYNFKIIEIKKATTILGSWFFITNIIIFYLINKINIPLIIIPFRLIFFINNCLGYLIDSILNVLSKKISLLKRVYVLYAGISIILQKI